MKLGGFFIALAFVLAACSSDPQPREPEPTPTASTAQPSPTATPPTMPAQASEDSPEGAAAFVSYWISLINFAATTGSTDELLAHSRGCAACESLVTALAAQESATRPAGQVWRPSRIVPDAVGARVTVEVVEGDDSEIYDLQFALTNSHPYSVRDIQRVTS